MHGLYASCINMADSEQGTTTFSTRNPVELVTSSTSQTDLEGIDSSLCLLQCPCFTLPSELARKGMIKTNLPSGVTCGEHHYTPMTKNVSVEDCLKAYPGENFASSNNRLFFSIMS